MASESARMSTAAEARFRVPVAESTPRVVKVIALDTATPREIGLLVDDLAAVDLVVMVVPAGDSADAAAIVGEACSRARVMTMAIVVRDETTGDEGLSRTLSQVRPWALNVVVAGDVGYVEAILRSFR